MGKQINNLKQVKEALPYGAITEIAKRSGVHYITAHNTLNGKHKNTKVLVELSKYLKEIKDAEKALYRTLVDALK